jgi:hypothetical protein
MMTTATVGANEKRNIPASAIAHPLSTGSGAAWQKSKVYVDATLHTYNYAQLSNVGRLYFIKRAGEMPESSRTGFLHAVSRSKNFEKLFHENVYTAMDMIGKWDPENVSLLVESIALVKDSDLLAEPTFLQKAGTMDKDLLKNYLTAIYRSGDAENLTSNFTLGLILKASKSKDKQQMDEAYGYLHYISRTGKFLSFDDWKSGGEETRFFKKS